MSHSRRTRFSAAWLLIAAALLLRAAVPTGWMPVTAEGGLRLMLCNGMGPVQFSARQAGQHHAHRQDHHDHHGDAPGPDAGGHDPCPYGLALGKSLDLPTTADVLPQALSVAFPLMEAGRAILLPLPRNLRPPARAPPSAA